MYKFHRDWPFQSSSSLPETDRLVCHLFRPSFFSSLFFFSFSLFFFSFLFFPLFFIRNPPLQRCSQFCIALSGVFFVCSEITKRLNMKHCAIQQNSYAACEDIWASAAVAGRSMERKETVVCPKPRRLGLTSTTLDPTYARPLRWHFSHHQEDYDAKAGNELLDIILAKGGSSSDQSVPQVASSPPFFSGSPPSRVSNPLIQDARFGDEKFTPAPPLSGVAPSPSSTRKGGCVRSNFGNNPVVRIEGFDCLDRDRRNRSIPALA